MTTQTDAQKAASKTIERMRTEIMYEHARIIKKLREELEVAEADLDAIQRRVRTLELKLKVSEKTNEKLQQDYEQFKLSNSEAP
jgi:flagellar motility protein MotE (MotC chaperone)